MMPSNSSKTSAPASAFATNYPDLHKYMTMDTEKYFKEAYDESGKRKKKVSTKGNNSFDIITEDPEESESFSSGINVGRPNKRQKLSTASESKSNPHYKEKTGGDVESTSPAKVQASWRDNPAFHSSHLISLHLLHLLHLLLFPLTKQQLSSLISLFALSF